MPKPLEDPVLAVYQASVMVASLGTVLVLIGLRFRGPLLRFQPRKLVPWNAAAALLAVLLVSFAVLSAMTDHDDHEKDAKAEQAHAASRPEDSASAQFRIATAIVEQIVIVGGALFLVVVYFNATRQDLGLPANFRQLGKDILIGVVAALGAMVPVFTIMLIVSGPEMKSEHPLVEMLSKGGPDVTMFILSSVAAVIVAPICEEITFRLFLQGWLEKCEAKLRGIVRAVPAHDLPLPSENQLSSPPIAPQFESSAPEGQSNVDQSTANDIAPSNPSEMLVDKSHGWFAIIISAALFGLAHIGYGPEPIPLFFLALVLGYLYSRTHRIVPSMVAHALFNTYTMVALWRLVFYDHIGLQ